MGDARDTAKKKKADEKKKAAGKPAVKAAAAPPAAKPDQEVTPVQQRIARPDPGTCRSRASRPGSGHSFCARSGTAYGRARTGRALTRRPFGARVRSGVEPVLGGIQGFASSAQP